MGLNVVARKILSRLYRWDAVKNFKDDVAVLLRHSIFGKKFFYKVLDIVKDLEKKQKKEVGIIFDIGALIGEKAYVLAKSFPKATVYCFEPIPQSFERLRKRVSCFGERVKCYNFGFYNTNGIVDMYAIDTGDPISLGVSSLIPFEQQTRFRGEDRKKKISVKVRTLDDFFKKSGIEKIDFMKVDVEGSEKEILECGKEALKHTDNIFLEILPTIRGFHSHDYIDTLEFLYQLGFTFEGVYEDFLFTRLLE